MMRNLMLLLSVLLALSCQQDGPCVPDDTPRARTYTTNTSGLRFHADSVAITAPLQDDFNITLTGETFQTVEGFGFAITQASCFNLLRMSAADRTAFLREVFSREEGLGSSLVRVCIGGSDFSLDEFTWCDRPGIENFAVHPLDEQYLFPILDEIFAINPAVKIIASPWSCPRWMKMSEMERSPSTAGPTAA